jgi:hypothetical protein
MPHGEYDPKEQDMTEPPPLDFARLLDWVEGRLSEQEAQLVVAQVDRADEATRATLAWVRAFHAARPTMLLEAPPAETRAALTARFAEYARQQRGPGMLRRLLATLAFDSTLQPTAAGVRVGDMSAPLRQLVYSADVADIALTIQPRPRDQRLDLSGQLLPKQPLDTAAARVALERDGAEVDATAADDLGEFGFEALEPGSYALTLTSGGLAIALGPFELRR